MVRSSVPQCAVSTQRAELAASHFYPVEDTCCRTHARIRQCTGQHFIFKRFATPSPIKSRHWPCSAAAETLSTRATAFFKEEVRHVPGVSSHFNHARTLPEQPASAVPSFQRTAVLLDQQDLVLLSTKKQSSPPAQQLRRLMLDQPVPRFVLHENETLVKISLLQVLGERSGCFPFFSHGFVGRLRILQPNLYA